MRVQDGPLGHLRDVVDQRNAQVIAEIHASAASRATKARVTAQQAVSQSAEGARRTRPRIVTSQHVDAAV
jgi:hypothetical protein